MSLEEGKSLTLKLNVPSKKATWKSSNKKVATVSKSGKITAKKKGTTTITAKYNGYTVKCKVKVIDQNPLNKWFGTVKSNVNIQTKSFVYYDESYVCFDDFSDEYLLYYAQRLIFEIEIEGATIYCYAEYTYDDNAPYSFSFHKTIENDDDDDL